MTTTCDEYRSRLAAAELALDKVLTGKGVQSLRAGEKQLTYTEANVGELRKYIDELRAIVANCDGTRSNKRRIVRFIPEG